MFFIGKTLFILKIIYQTNRLSNFAVQRKKPIAKMLFRC